MKKFLFSTICTLFLTMLCIGLSAQTRTLDPNAPVQKIVPSQDLCLSDFKVVPPNTPAPKGMVNVSLEAYNVWGDGSGYQLLLDATATAHGPHFPSVGSAWCPCACPSNKYDWATHKLPASATPSCTSHSTYHVNGIITFQIPAGTYDYCIANLEMGNAIWIAGGENGYKDNYVFQDGKKYNFKAEMFGSNDRIVITVEDDGGPTDVTITTAVTPEGAGTVTGGGTKPSGSNFTLTAIPNAGYIFDKWTPGNATTNPLELTNVTANATYTANFKTEGDCNPAKALNVVYAEDCSKATLTWSAPTKSNRGNIARGRVAYGGPKYIQFDADNIMGHTTINTTLECYGGGYLNGKLYCYKTLTESQVNKTVTFQIVNSETGVIENSIERPELYGLIISSLCYDYSTNTMYAVRGNPNILSKVNLTTGELTQVATISGLGAGIPLTFAINLAGNAYIIESAGGATGNAKLYSINLSTGACTVIGSGTGFSMNYAQSMAFDYNDPDCPLYWAQIDQVNSVIQTNWVKVNTTTGAAAVVTTNIGMEICALHFPYEHGGPGPGDVAYNVYRGDEKLTPTPIEAATFEDKTFDKTKAYTWSVKVACEGGGESAPITKAMDACYVPTCVPVTAPAVSFEGCAKAIVNWTAVAGAKEYEITRGGITTKVTAPPFTDEAAFESNKTYTWEIVTVCEEGKSTAVSVSGTGCVGINESTNTFSIVPNPATNDITITSKSDFNKIEVVNFLGQTVITEQNNGNSAKLDISTLTNGVYFIRIATENGASVMKFVKQ